MVTQEGEQGHSALLPLFYFPTSAFANRHQPGLTRPVGKKSHMADEEALQGLGWYLSARLLYRGW